MTNAFNDTAWNKAIQQIPIVAQSLADQLTNLVRETPNHAFQQLQQMLLVQQQQLQQMQQQMQQMQQMQQQTQLFQQQLLTTISTLETRMIARTINSTYRGDLQPIEPIVTAQNTVPRNYPATKAALQTLPAQTVDQLLNGMCAKSCNHFFQIMAYLLGSKLVILVKERECLLDTLVLYRASYY
jgi:TolA-binding protein